MTPGGGRAYDPGLPGDLLAKQQIMANGMYCGHLLRGLGASPMYNADVYYPIDYFSEDEDPVFTLDTDETRGQGADNLPILAWIISEDGEEAAVAVDILERSKLRLDPVYARSEDEPVAYTNCKVIGGTPSNLLPEEILKRMGLI